MEVNANGVLVEELLSCPRSRTEDWVMNYDHFLSNANWNNLQEEEEEENPSLLSLQNPPLISDHNFFPSSSSSYAPFNQDLFAFLPPFYNNNINPLHYIPPPSPPPPLFLPEHHHHHVLPPPLPMGDHVHHDPSDDHKVVPLPSKPAGRTKKVEGQPSKNLMAERRRRKRLNDRLSMLRSIVPKITKMDRTSILGDTIDYMKELIQRIKDYQNREEDEHDDDDERRYPHMNIMEKFKNVKPKIESSVRNCPKFNVEMTSNGAGTRIDMLCATKPGLLLSTVNTLDSLGLDIQHCVISCFSDFSLQATCTQDSDQSSVVSSSEEIKQTLFTNSGYGGKCF